MDKQPLYSIDTLFQQKLEELPVDASLQHAQWQSLSKSMHQQPSGGFQSYLQKPVVKLLYMTVVALVPFAVYYFSHQQNVERKASPYIGNSVSRSLLLLNPASRPILSNRPGVQKQAVTMPPKKEASVVTIHNTSIPDTVQAVKATGSLPASGKDSAQTIPLKQEKPVIKKNDSSYIYWQ